MSQALTIVLVVVGAYLAAHVAFEWLGRRLLIVSGAEYLLLGILLGPLVSGVVSADLVESFAPVTALALGWTGAIIGSRLRLPEMVRVPGVVYRIAFTESLLTLTAVFGLELFLMRWLFDLTTVQAVGPALALGAIATVSADAGIALAIKRHGEGRPLVTQLRVSAGTNAFVGIVALGILLASTHPDPGALGRPLTPTEWTVISVAIGVVGGALFHLFLGAEGRVDRLFVSLAGVVILVSGAATYLRLSPLLSGMFFAAILVNTSTQREEIARTLARVERPLYFVLLLFAGATWRPSAKAAWVLPVLVFLIARAVAKIGGSRLAARANDMLDVLGPRWGQALLAQGGIALAIALNYLYQPLALPNVVFTAAVTSVLLTDLAAGRFAEAVLAPEADPRLARPDADEEAPRSEDATSDDGTPASPAVPAASEAGS